jgi:4-amino-4-deoxy-L-arabinose transferase-like glycosyltransferase
LALPWYLAAAWHDPVFFREFFWDHHVVLRFVQPLHEQPVWYYLPALFLGMLPWALLLPDVIKLVIRRTREQLPTEFGFFLLSCCWCLLFFSAAPCKRIGYILPAMPALALALGYALDRRLSGPALHGYFDFDRQTALPYWATQGVLAAGIGVSLICGFTGLAEPAEGVGLAALAGAGMAWLVIRTRTGSRRVAAPRWWLAGSWAGCAVVTFLFLFLSVHVLLPGYYRRFSLRAQVRSFMSSSDGAQAPVVCHPHHCDSVSFYLGRHDIRSFSREERTQMIADLGSRPETIVFVKTGRVLNKLLAALPESLEFVPRGRASWMTAGLIRQRTITAKLP